jgi:acetolactate decarboxylase
MRITILSCLLFSILSTSCFRAANESTNEVRIAGAMRNVMWKGQLEGTIALDSLSGNGNYYGVGPLEFLSGELLMVNGKIFVSTVLSDSTMKVVEDNQAKAPFFVYAAVPQWKEVKLPDSVTNLKMLDSYLLNFIDADKKPFAFKLEGKIDQAVIHIVNLPAGTQVSSPEQAHQGQINYTLKDEQVYMIGFFSTKHKGIFTHHDSNTHIHLITSDHLIMGHVDKASFTAKSLKLFLPLK